VDNVDMDVRLFLLAFSSFLSIFSFFLGGKRTYFSLNKKAIFFSLYPPYLKLILCIKTKILTKLKKKERLELKILTNLKKNLVKAS